MPRALAGDRLTTGYSRRRREENDHRLSARLFGYPGAENDRLAAAVLDAAR
jgi:hypothetical protein